MSREPKVERLIHAAVDVGELDLQVIQSCPECHDQSSFLAGSQPQLAKRGAARLGDVRVLQRLSIPRGSTAQPVDRDRRAFLRRPRGFRLTMRPSRQTYR